MLKDSIFSMFGKTYKSLTAMVFVMVVSRLFSATQYGTYRQIMLIGNTVNLILLLGINETISYHYRIIDESKRNQLITNMILFKVSAAFPIILSIYIFKSYLSTVMNNFQISVYMPVIVILTAAYVIESIIESYYLGAGKVVLLSKLEILAYTLHYAAAVTIVLIYKSELYLLIELAIFESIKTVFLFAVIFKKEKFVPDFDWSFMKALVKFAVPVGISLIIITMNIYVDQLMISFYYKPEDFAVYNNGAMSIPIIQLLTMSVGAVILPKMSVEAKEKSFKEGLAVWRTAATHTAMVLMTFMWLFMIFARGYVSFLFSDKYLDSVPIMRVYLLRFLIAFAVYSYLLMVIDKKRYIGYIAFAGLVTNIILNIVFIKWFGMIGAAIATVIVQFMTNIMEVIVVMWFEKVKITEIFEFDKMLKILVTSGSTALTMNLVANYFSLGDIWNFFIYGSIYVLITFGLFFWTGQLDMQLLVVLKKKIPFVKGA